jgi:hypothetical protein
LLGRCYLRWRKTNGSRRGHFIVLRCVRHWIITVVSTPRIAHSPTLIATRSRTGRSLSAACLCVAPACAGHADRRRQEAQAGGGVAVFLPLVCHRMFPPMFSTVVSALPSTGGACAVDYHCLVGVLFIFLGEETRDQARAFHRFAVRPPLDHHRCFHTPLAHASHAHRNPAADQVDCCLPRHRQAVGLQCFYHWRVAAGFHRMFPSLARLALHRGGVRR